MKRLIPLILLLASCATKEIDLSCTNKEDKISSCVAIKKETIAEKIGMGGPLFAWVKQSNLWPINTEEGYVDLKVQFLDGTPKQRSMAKKRFDLVDSHAEGLRLYYVESNGDIRVSFEGEGHWSYLGRVAKNIPKNQRTLNISLRSNDTWVEWDRVGIHEFLHALGFEHEHQHPNSEIPWNVPVVINYYRRTQGWDEATTRYQVIERENPTDMITNGFRDDSIMMYPVDPQLTTNGYSVGWNTELTECDIDLLKKLYPAP